MQSSAICKYLNALTFSIVSLPEQKDLKFRLISTLVSVGRMGFLEVTDRSKVWVSVPVAASLSFLLRKGSLHEFSSRVSSYTQFALSKRKIETLFKEVTQTQ